MNRNLKRALAPLIIIVSCGIFFGLGYFTNDNWKKNTTPLPEKTINILCENFELDQKDALCNHKRMIYAPDFFSVIRKSLRPEIEFGWDAANMVTYQDVDNKLGLFKFECEPLTSQDHPKLDYFRCGYDLRGDGVSIIGIYFKHPENTVYRMDTLIRQMPEKFWSPLP